MRRTARCSDSCQLSPWHSRNEQGILRLHRSHRHDEDHDDDGHSLVNIALLWMALQLLLSPRRLDRPPVCARLWEKGRQKCRSIDRSIDRLATDWLVLAAIVGKTEPWPKSTNGYIAWYYCSCYRRRFCWMSLEWRVPNVGPLGVSKSPNRWCCNDRWCWRICRDYLRRHGFRLLYPLVYVRKHV